MGVQLHVSRERYREAKQERLKKRKKSKVQLSVLG